MNDKNTPRAIALGYFDGVHLGHKALMDKAVLRAKEIGGISSVFTFDQHPSSVMSGTAVPMLTAKATRADEIKKFGKVDEVIFGHFDDNLRTMDWKATITAAGWISGIFLWTLLNLCKYFHRVSPSFR